MAKQRKQTERNQIIQDEIDASVREGERQAAVERDKVLDALEEAEAAAAKQDTAKGAKETFWQKFKAFFAGDGI